jgi:phosphatidylglycerol:prolipoprotein diacylglycerol transferase
MLPKLFSIGPFTVYSYGLMLAIGFIVGSYFLTKNLQYKKMNPDIGSEVTLLAIVFGIIGAKIFSLVENWDTFIANPFGEIFSPGGLTFYGGFLLAVLAIFIYMKRKKIPFLVMADAAAPSLVLAYGIGRIGCHLAGDGDYGIPTSLPWGTDYSKGTVPPSHAFWGTKIAEKYPNGIVPDHTPLHPTSMYEFIMGLIIFLILWNLRKKPWPTGKLFMVYLIMAGSARFLVEFIRINPDLLFGLSEAQTISIVLIISGLIGLYHYSKKNITSDSAHAAVESGTK